MSTVTNTMWTTNFSHRKLLFLPCVLPFVLRLRLRLSFRLEIRKEDIIFLGAQSKFRCPGSAPVAEISGPTTVGVIILPQDPSLARANYGYIAATGFPQKE